MSIVEHIILFSFLFLVFSYAGKTFYNEKDTTYWLFGISLIVIYSLIVGFRYGWGPDYYSYKYRFENAFVYNEEQLGFKWLNQTMLLLGFNYVAAYVTYSFIFISTCFILIRSYGAESKWMYALLLPATVGFVNYAIRQGVALSFILLAIYYFDKKKWLNMSLVLLIGISIHTSVIITAAMIAGSYLLIRKPLNWKITIPLYLFFAFLFNSAKISAISPYLEKYVSLNNQFQGYIDNSDVWFGADAAEADKYAQSWTTLILSSFFYIAIIYFGYFALKYKPNKRIMYLYNSTVIGIIFYRIVFFFEILRRLAEPLIMINFIVLGYAIYVFSKVKKRPALVNMTNEKDIKLFVRSINLYKIGISMVVFYLVLFWGRFIFFNETAKFFWNK